MSDALRGLVYRLPPVIKHWITDLIAAVVYWPLSRLAKVLEFAGVGVHGLPLSYYRNHSFYTMRTDSRDRFGTPLEKRFTRFEISNMMTAAGLDNISFSQAAPYWCVVGIKR
jgi:hypothetical protein